MITTNNNKINIVSEWLTAFNKTESADLKIVFMEALKDLPDEIQELNDGYELRDLERLHKIAHKMKGLYGILNITEIYELCNILNIETLKNNCDFIVIGEILKTMKEWLKFIKVEEHN